MGKRAKGLDAVRQRNLLKKSMLSSCKAYAEQLEAENYQLKNDPNTVIGSFIGQFRELYGQNQRLSTLAAALIKKLDDKVVISKDEMESYNGKRINIKWEIAEGETVETAKEFTFTYELQDAPPEGQPVQATEQPGQGQAVVMADHDCTDPNCTVGQDVPHRHAVVPAQAETPSVTEEEAAAIGASLQSDWVNEEQVVVEDASPLTEEAAAEGQ